MTGREKFGILSKLARERVRKEPERGSGPNLENDPEERNAQEERSRGEADRKGNPGGGSGREAGDAAKDSEDSKEFSVEGEWTRKGTGI